MTGSTVAKNATSSTRTIEVPSISVVTKAEGSRVLPVDVFEARMGETRAFLDAVRKGDSIGMWNQAVLTWNAFHVSGFVGGQDLIDGTRISKDAAKYPTQGDYARNALGVQSEGYVTRLKYLARAIYVHGIREGSEDWRILSQNADKGAFPKVLKGDDTDAVKQALKDHKAGTKPKPVAKGTDGPKVTEPETKAEKPSDGLLRTPADLGMAWSQVIVPSLHLLSDSDAETIRATMLADLTKDAERRQALAEKAEREAERKALAEQGDAERAAKVAAAKDAPKVPSPALVAQRAKAAKSEG